MTASTTLITDFTTAAGSTPNAASLALAIAAAGPIQSIQGNTALILRKFQEAKVLMTSTTSVIDSSDTTLKAFFTNGLLTLT